MIQLDDFKTSVAAFISLISAGIGTGIDFINDLCLFPLVALNINILDKVLQEIAWIVAILAGLVSIVNGIKNWFKRNGIRKSK